MEKPENEYRYNISTLTRTKVKTKLLQLFVQIGHFYGTYMYVM